MMSIDKLLEQATDYAHRVLIGHEGAQVIPTFCIQFDHEPTTIVAAPWADDHEKSMTIDLMRAMLKIKHAHSYSFVSEAWMATEDRKRPLGLMPSEREDKREVVIVIAHDRRGGGQVRTYEIKRNAKGVISDLMLDPDTVDSFGGRLHNLFDDA
jgi:hypothetical protein